MIVRTTMLARYPFRRSICTAITMAGGCGELVPAPDSVSATTVRSATNATGQRSHTQFHAYPTQSVNSPSAIRYTAKVASAPVMLIVAIAVGSAAQVTIHATGWRSRRTATANASTVTIARAIALPVDDRS